MERRRRGEGEPLAGTQGLATRERLIWLLVVVAVVVVAGLAIAYLSLRPAPDAPLEPVVTSAPADETPVPTAEPAPSGDPLGDVAVDITYLEINPDSGAVDASAVLVGRVEEGGTCVLRLVRGDALVTAESAAAPDAQSTQCGLITIERDRLASGSWLASVQYRSASGEIESAAQEIEVP